MEFLSIVLSILSLIVSLSVAFKAWHFNELSIRRSSREFHVKSLSDIYGTYMSSPELWAIYDDHPLARERDASELAQGRRDAMIYQHLNMFEFVRDYYTTIIRRSEVDEEYWTAWDEYVRYLLRHSERTRLLLADREVLKSYSRTFVEYITGVRKEIEEEMRQSMAGLRPDTAISIMTNKRNT